MFNSGYRIFKETPRNSNSNPNPSIKIDDYHIKKDHKIQKIGLFNRWKMRGIVASALSLVTLMIGLVTPVHAQNGIIAAGDAAVTALSGILSAPSNGSEFFDINGPSVRVINLPASDGFGLKDASKPFTVTAREVGQVFGITLDDQAQPNIYVAATSAYGLAIYKSDVGRLKKGEPSAEFMIGQFGPAEQGGGPSSIWRIDGKTGKVTLFANVAYPGVENAPAALGALAFDATTQQIFVSDRTTGMIHRFSMDGMDHGFFDHGVQGLSAGGQPQVAFDPSTIANIKSPDFDTENPKTWGYAPPERRVFALAVYKHRLYYSVLNSKIWSVGIASDGAFANDARFEVDVPGLKSDTEISSIAFDDEGFMYVAERAAPTGNYDFIVVAPGGQNRVKRFAPKTSGDAASGLWTTPGDQYSVGMLPNYQNADGGVAIKCNRIVWKTGDHLLDPGGSPAESFPHIDGLQGTDKKLVQPANMPPKQSWYVNYYDVEAHPESAGHMGAIVLLNICEGYTPPSAPPPTTPPNQPTCPPGTFLIDCVCLIPPLCPEGTVFRDGYCIFEMCQWPLVLIDNKCVTPPIDCGYGKVFINDHCVQVPCPPDLEYGTRGYCRCPNDFYYQDGRCIPLPFGLPRWRLEDGICVPWCPPEQAYVDGKCVCPPYQTYENGKCLPTCPPDQRYEDGRCKPSTCPPYQTYVDGRCQPSCPPGQRYIDGRCRPACPPNQRYIDGTCKPSCPPYQTYRDGRCRPSCPPNQRYVDGKCRPQCPSYMRYVNGRCVPPVCPANQRYVNGRCVSYCPPNYRYLHGRCVPACPSYMRYVNGRCVPITRCRSWEVLRNGVCVPRTRLCPQGQRLVHGRCIPIQRTCPPGQVMINGRCRTVTGPNRSPCPVGQIYRNGRCVPRLTTPPGINRVTPPMTQPSGGSSNKPY